MTAPFKKSHTQNKKVRKVIKRVSGTFTYTVMYTGKIDIIGYSGGQNGGNDAGDGGASGVYGELRGKACLAGDTLSCQVAGPAGTTYVTGTLNGVSINMQITSASATGADYSAGPNPGGVHSGKNGGFGAAAPAILNTKINEPAPGTQVSGGSKNDNGSNGISAGGGASGAGKSGTGGTGASGALGFYEHP